MILWIYVSKLESQRTLPKSFIQKVFTFLPHLEGLVALFESRHLQQTLLTLVNRLF